MPDRAARRSPIHEDLEARGAEWRLVAGVSFAVRFRDEPAEQAAAETLAICDLSGLQKFGVKGRDAESWLASEGVEVPAAIFDSRSLADDGVIARFGADEFFLEDGVGGQSVPAFSERLDHSSQVFRVEHQEATFLLLGSRALKVLAQTCGINFREMPQRKVVFTRVAGVSCAILPETVGDVPAYRIWVDPGYALYLWQDLAEICESMKGSVIGVRYLFPEVLSRYE